MGRVELEALYPFKKGEQNYTSRLLSHAREHGTNRQCSIGWHDECSDPRGESCQCLCHEKGVELWTVEGHVEGGAFAITRAEQGQHKWPPVEGEPATMWAHWVLGASEEDAKARALNKEAAALGLEPVKPEHLAAVPGMGPVKPDPGIVLAEKVAGLTGVAATTWRDYKAGIIGVDEYNKQREWAEADLTEAWREYVHALD